MSLNILRKHKKSCSADRHDRTFRRCKCPIHVEGTLEGKLLRVSTKTNVWERAQEMVAEAMRNGYWGPSPVAAIPVTEALAQWIADAEARNLKPNSMRRIKYLAKQMTDWAETRHLNRFEQWNMQITREFRQSWADGPISARKKLERLRSFFRFAIENEWTRENPAAKIKLPLAAHPPTLPFSEEEMGRIYAAIATYREMPKVQVAFADRLRALVMLMESSGLRIGDAVSVTRADLKGDRLILSTAKTGTKVRIPLPPPVMAMLSSVEREDGSFFRGNGELDTDTGNYRRALRRIGTLAKVGRLHPHRFRDTFSVNLLAKGVSLEHVAKLLGHASIKVTERHYAPWVPRLQDQLEAAVKATWERPALQVIRKTG